MSESGHTTAGTSSSSSSSESSIKWQLKSTLRRQRIRQDTIHSEPSFRSISNKTRKRSRSAPGSVERAPEIEPPTPALLSRDNLVTVKFALPNGGVLTRAFPGLTPISQVRNVLAPLVGAHAADLELTAGSTDTKAEDDDVLADLGVATFGVLSLRITAPADARLCRDAGDILTAPPPDVLTVLVRGTKDKRAREVVVEVQRAGATGGVSVKPFLGGFRNVRTGKTFHHAATQTDRYQPTKLTEMFSRDTQAGVRCHHTTWTVSDRTIQTGIPPGTTEGYVVIHGDADRFKADQTKRYRSACIVQRCLRAWLHRKKHPVVTTQATPPPIPGGDHSDYERHKRAVGEEPDIPTLLNAVYEWRQAEEERLQKITADLTQRAERLDVLAEEARRLAQVDAIRAERREARRRRQQEALLRKAARPKSWKGSTGRRLEADTPTTMRYRRLLEIYEQTIKSWKKEPASLTQVADSLHQILFGMASSDDISRLEILIRRRVNYLERKASGDGRALLERVRDLFLEIPQANQPITCPPGARCRSCRRSLPTRKFAIHTRVHGMRRCITCSRLPIDQKDFAIDTKFKKLTEMMQRNEISMSDGMKLPAGSQPAFLLQPEDIRLLATRIWPGRSVLGGAPQLDRLRLGRWHCWEPFSPWNCVLLTESELGAHVGSTAAYGPQTVYAPSLLARVRRRHLQGSLRFRELEKIQQIDDDENKQR